MYQTVCVYKYLKYTVTAASLAEVLFCRTSRLGISVVFQPNISSIPVHCKCGTIIIPNLLNRGVVQFKV